MSEKNYSEIEAHEHFAKAANQKAWELLGQEGRTVTDNIDMISAAHTSMFHWGRAGTGVHMQRSLWLLARVYTVLGYGKFALSVAQSCQEATEKYADDLSDFDIAYASEALARAYALNNDLLAAIKHYEKAKELGDQISDPEDREIFFGDFDAEPWNGVNK
jgi:hypothetical protein